MTQNPPVKHLWRNFWMLLKPFWASREGRTKGILLLLLVLILTAGAVYLQKILNSWHNEFYNSIQEYNYPQFKHLVMTFAGLATIWVLVGVHNTYFNQMLQIVWRRWLTEHKAAHWLSKSNFYRLQLTDNKTDNPDQRIAEDINEFVSSTLSLSIGFLSQIAMLFTFLSVLWMLSKPCDLNIGSISLGSFQSPAFTLHLAQGFMVWAVLIYCVGGTILTFLIGRPLVRLNFQQQRYEADFRFSLIRVRENAESIALYHGNQQEGSHLRDRFKQVVQNYFSLMKRQKILGFFTFGFNQAAVIFPIILAAPLYFSKQFTMGDLMQTLSAFGIVQGSLSLLIDNYSDLARWKSVVDRLATFENGLESAEKLPRIHPEKTGSALKLQALKVSHPNGQVLMKPSSWTLQPGESLLIQGPSGCGKSTLIRSLAGLWPYAQGQLYFPTDSETLFLSQKPYLPQGTLRQVLSYPGPEVSEEKAKHILHQVGLDKLLPQLESEALWSHMLSLGEQQRIAFARILLLKPDVIFLDEATSALDEASEGLLYMMIQTELPHAILVSVGHRNTLVAYHSRKLQWQESLEWQFA